MQDRYEMLHPTEKKKADAFIARHREKDPAANFITTMSVSGYGYRAKVMCQNCGTREDVTDDAKRDPYPHR